MRKIMIWLGVTTATGVVTGMLLDRKKPQQGGLIGAVAGAITGAVTAELYNKVTEDDGIGYYSNSSPLYENPDDMDYV